MDTAVGDRAQELLEVLAGPEARLRDDQAAAIDAVVRDRRRALVVQRTGFGKSAIYFIATKLLRDSGAGPTLLVSPLLALMRDQVAAAARMGVRSATINSTNADAWTEIEDALATGEIDLLCISPERLNSPGFVRRVLPGLAGGLGLLVVDEAHCISDWGHDFRPDYRRIRDAIASLAPGTPVIATTATANARVCADVADQLGDDDPAVSRPPERLDSGARSAEEAGIRGVAVLRGPLDRESLVLGVSRLPDLASRLAWLAQRIPSTEGTGIVYCLTVAQTEHVAAFLQSRGIDARAYSSESEGRESLEEDFKANRCKVLVATSALGMGVDKPDVAFVYHLGAPPSPIAYYQQVGRAGRSIDRAEARLLPGEEDERIWDWFASVGLPSEPLVRRVLDAIGDKPVSLPALERVVDLRRTRLETLLKILDVEGAVRRVEGGWERTSRRYEYDHERVRRVREARKAEANAMLAYAAEPSCLMELLRTSLDDAEAAPCGRCAVCTGSADPVTLDTSVVRDAVSFLRGLDVVLEPRRAWPRGMDAPRGNIRPERRAAEGRALCREGDAGWWPAVSGATQIDGELEAGIVALLKRWNWDTRPAWVTWVPSATSALPERLARRIAEIGRLPVHEAIARTRKGRPQSALENSAHRCANVWRAFAVTIPGPGPVLLVDDVYDSGWTVTVVADALREAGADEVLPLVLTRR